MRKSYQFSETQIKELEAAEKKNKDKNLDRRIKAVLYRAKGFSRGEAAKKTGFAPFHVTRLTALYCENGLAALAEKHYSGNHRNLTFEQEEQMLDAFAELEENGQIVETSDILAEYEKLCGRTFEKDHGRIYRVLERHGWRKIKPRSRHPKKAQPEVIEASKKLTLDSKN